MIMFASSRVTSSRWPFLRIGLILLAYSFCFLGGVRWRGERDGDVLCAGETEDVQLGLVERHVAEGEAREDAGEDDEDGDEDGADDEAGVVVLAFGETGMGDMFRDDGRDEQDEQTDGEHPGSRSTSSSL